MPKTLTKEVKKTVTASPGKRFTNLVMKEFNAILDGSFHFSVMQKKLAQHLFIKIDQALKSLEAKRISTGQTKKAPIVWENINLQKLATDAVHRINLGLDALIPNHLNPIPYWNSKENCYDLDLRIGYAGKDYYRRKMAINPPKDIIYQLVYETDYFKPIMKGIKNDIESYEFEIKNPFKRGKIVGGFGYIIHEDPSLNKLVIVTEKDFERSENCSKNNVFWKDNPVEMRQKTITHRTTDKLIMDPQKINESFAIVEMDDSEKQVLGEIEENANKKLIDIEPEKGGDNGNNETEEFQTGTEPEQETLPETEGPGF